MSEPRDSQPGDSRPSDSRPGDERRGDERRGDAPSSAEERLAQEAVRGLPRATADPAFRERLKADFTSGAIDALPAPTAHKTRPVSSRPLPFPWAGGPLPGWRTTVAIAATIIAVVLTGILNQGPGWRIAAVRGPGIIMLDGTPLTISDVAAIGRRIPAGVQVVVPVDTEIDFRAGNLLAMQCTPGTDLTLPPTPARWFARRTSLYVRGGEIRVTTGPSFRGASLQVMTPDAELRVHGTTFAVILEPSGTCVCVYEGTVSVGAHGIPSSPIPAGMRRYVFRDGRLPEDAGMRDVEREMLAVFREAQMAAMKVR